jgi:hypothetical protein
MMHFKTIFGVGVVAVALSASACAAEPVESTSDEAPTADLGAIDPQDEGSGYNGWLHETSIIVQANYGFTTLTNTFWRNGGEATRGGGGCYVVGTGAGCSSDATCLSSAQATYGASAWGYCYQGGCYARPGSQAAYCSLSPNRSPGQATNAWFSISLAGNQYGLSCLTKTGGPNTACGGTNTSLYMRYVTPAYINWQTP